MMRVAVMGAGFALACGNYPKQPVKPIFYEYQCHEPLFVGVPVKQHISWTCDLGQEGRRGSFKEGRCIAAITTNAWCPDDRCTTAVEAVPQYGGYNGLNKIDITPTQPGPIEVWAELRHEVGLVEKHRLLACEVLPLPEYTLGCAMRDPRSGAYVPCPAEVPAGAEVHLTAGVRLAPGQARMPDVDLYLDGKELDVGSSYRRGPVECTRTDGEQEPRHRSFRCSMATAIPGAHTFEIEMERLPKQSLSFTVRTP